MDCVPNTWKVRENVYELWILAVGLSFFILLTLITGKNNVNHTESYSIMLAKMGSA